MYDIAIQLNPNDEIHYFNKGYIIKYIIKELPTKK